MSTPLLILIILILIATSLRFLSKFYYSVAIKIYHVLIFLVSPVNKKARAGIRGRKNLFKNLEANFNFPQSKKIWMHCASLGEFEQGRPVIEKLRNAYPDHKILLTFYSPSGYEQRKNFAGADYITYLPLDSKRNAKKFIRIAKPDLAIFVKYEFWIHHLCEIQKNKIPLFLISAVFRKKQLFFKWYGNVFKQTLRKYTMLFVQDEDSLALLSRHKISNAAIAFDTRFDRVTEIAETHKENKYVSDFTANHNVLIAGSTWPMDEKIISGAFYHSLVYNNFKLVIAPHNIDKKFLRKTYRIFKKYALRYSEISNAKPEDIAGKRVLILDNIGLLSTIYKYADVCYIGGGYNKGIHNTLEAAVYGKPLLFGPKYKKFKEAVEMVEKGIAFPVNGPDDILQRINFMNQFNFVFSGAGSDAKEYVASHRGGTQTIVNSLANYL